MARSPQKHLDRAAKSQNQGMWGEACEAGGLRRQRGEVEQETCLQAAHVCHALVPPILLLRETPETRGCLAACCKWRGMSS